jgi:hypothetical protein
LKLTSIIEDGKLLIGNLWSMVWRLGELFAVLWCIDGILLPMLLLTLTTSACLATSVKTSSAPTESKDSLAFGLPLRGDLLYGELFVAFTAGIFWTKPTPALTYLWGLLFPSAVLMPLPLY